MQCLDCPAEFTLSEILWFPDESGSLRMTESEGLAMTAEAEMAWWFCVTNVLDEYTRLIYSQQTITITKPTLTIVKCVTYTGDLY